MAIKVYELATSRQRTISWDGADTALEFIASGSTNDALIYPAVIALSPKTYTVLGPTGFPVRLRRKDVTLDPLGADYWKAAVAYGFQAGTADDLSDEPDFDDTAHLGPEWNFETTGGTQHITQSLETISRTAIAGGTAPDYKGAIGVTRDSVAGTDIVAPKLEFSCTLQKAFINLPYLRGLARCTGKTNAAKWYGFEIGEVLYLGATGSAKPGERFSVTHRFAAGENLSNIVVSGSQLYLTGTTTATSTTVAMGVTTGINVGDRVYGTGIPTGATVAAITPGVSITLSAAATTSTTQALLFGSATGLVIPGKRAWEYLWCAYVDQTNANILVQVPVASYVERVYRSADFGSIL